jgi:hypothetical protein
MFAPLTKLFHALTTLAGALTELAGTVQEANHALRHRLSMDPAAEAPALPSPTAPAPLGHADEGDDGAPAKPRRRAKAA